MLRRTLSRVAIPDTLVEHLAMLGALALLVIFFSVATDHFFSRETFTLIANQIPTAVILAVGMTYVLIIAGIDLSVGSVLALSSAVLGVLMVKLGAPLVVGVLAALAVGALCGLVNGFVTVTWRLPSFIVTLGMLQIARGTTFLVTASETQYIGSRVQVLAEANVLGLSLPFVLALALVIVAQLVLTRTVFGRHMIALGTNEEAVRLSGIDPRRIRLVVFAVCGLLAAVASVSETARVGSALPNAGEGYELQAIAAVVIGGTSLMGGRGSVVRSFFGVLIIAVLGAGLVQVGAKEPTKRLVTGLVIVAAVILDYYRQRLRGRALARHGASERKRVTATQSGPAADDTNL
ncbi:MAG: ABC transporter permease [Planctomycetota bacterium]|jgi:ribose transport system permease protein